MSDESTTTNTPAAAKKIVVGIDGSEESLRALDWAAKQADLTGSALDLIATWEFPNYSGWAPFPTDYDPESELKKMLDPIVSKVVSEHPKLKVTTKIIEGHPAPVLVEQSEGADLLVVGSRGHGEFVGMLIGSTSEHCTANAKCSVVVVRTGA